MVTVGLITSRSVGSVVLNTSRLSGFNVRAVDRGQRVRGLRFEMIDEESLDQLSKVLNDRFTVEELCEILNLSVDDLINKFIDEILEINWNELL